MKRYRTHFNLIWKLEGDFLRRSCKGLGPPGSYDPKNQHGGRMPALPRDFRLSDLQAGKIIFRCAQHSISYDQLRGISGMFSYLFSIATGQQGENFPEVKSVFSSYQQEDFQKTRSLIPESIPTPEKLKKAFTTPYSTATGIPFALWVTGLLACYCWSLFGARSGCDLNSLKKSSQHTINLDQRWASTAYVNGRNKLCGKKKGSRPWSCFFTCFCPEGKHQPVSKTWALTAFNKDGSLRKQPNFCTECPLNCLKLKEFRSDPEPFFLFSKWTKTVNNWGGNHGNVVGLAIRWLGVQGASTDIPYHTNAGRKSLAGMLTVTKAPYPEGHEIHGDHPDVWIPVYQPSCPWSDFSRRTQSTDPHVATTALRRFAFYFGRSKAPEIEVNLTLQERLLTALMHAQGQSKLAEDTIHEHRILHPEEAEEVADAVQQTVRANGQEFGIEGVIPPQPEMYGDD
jgi:hypothetical protein